MKIRLHDAFEAHTKINRETKTVTFWRFYRKNLFSFIKFLFKTAVVIRDGPGPSGTIFQSVVVRYGPCSDRVNSGMVRGGTVLILGDNWRSGVVRCHPC